MIFRVEVLSAGLITIAKLVGGLLITKMVAASLGVVGIGLLGQLQSVIGILIVVASSGYSLGITRYAAEYGKNDSRLKSIIGAAVFNSLIISTIIFLITYAQSEYISTLIFKTSAYEKLISVLGPAVFFGALATIFISILIGLNKSKMVANSQFAAMLLSVLATFLLLKNYGVVGGIFSTLLSACALFFPAIYYIKKQFKFIEIIPKLNYTSNKLLYSYGLMAFLSVICINGAQILIREWLGANHGLTEVGYWQAISKISDAYLQIINVYLAIYLMPKLASINNEMAYLEIKKTIKTIAPLMLLMLAIIYFLRSFVVNILFSKDFDYVNQLFLPQMAGDFFKIMAYIPGYLAIARGYKVYLFAAEPIQFALLVTLTYFTVSDYGSEGILWAYATAYFTYMVIVFFGFNFIKKGYLK